MTTLPPPTGGSPSATAEVLDAVHTAPAPGPGRPKTRKTGQFRDVWRRYRRNKLAVLGLLIVGLLAFLAIFEPIITPYDPFEQNLFNTTSPPGNGHLFGTDVLGRDMFSAIIYGTKLAMIVGLVTVGASLLIGVTFGAIAGFFGGAVDSVISRVIDVFLAFPLLVGAILIVRTFGAGITPVIIALAIFGWTTAARLMRGQTLALRESEYVEAARSIGATNSRILTRHVLPNAIAPVLVYSFTSIGVVVVALASLSYLGVGVPADVPEWGRMISQANAFLSVPGKSHLWIFPSLAIVLTTLGFAFVADGLRDALDPKLRGRD